jgi:RNA polymerase sigma-70 factor (ECF subfamily)
MSIAMTAAEPSHREQASARANASFEKLAEAFRRELKLHCYRMLGSLHEAEDLVQETYLRAWRSFDSFEGPSSSFRAWLYRIATNACLNALASRKQVQRLLPDQQVPATDTVQLPDGAPPADVAWLEPYPDAHLEGIADDAPNPEARYASREAVQLAFVAAIQQLPSRQRAALLLCDVLGWATAEATTLLGGSTASINSSLQRARETLAKRYPDGRPPVVPRPNPVQQKLLGRYLKAWEGHDLDGFVALLKEDATFTMPPWLQWYAGREAIGSFFATAWRTCGGLRLVPTAANGQPAFAAYERSGAEARWTAHAIHVLALQDDVISTLTLFVPPAGPHLFHAFGLPLILPDARSADLASAPHPFLRPGSKHAPGRPSPQHDSFDDSEQIVDDEPEQPNHDQERIDLADWKFLWDWIISAPMPGNDVSISTSKVTTIASGIATRIPSRIDGTTDGMTTWRTHRAVERRKVRATSRSSGSTWAAADEVLSKIGQIADKATTVSFIVTS